MEQWSCYGKEGQAALDEACAILYDLKTMMYWWVAWFVVSILVAVGLVIH